MNYGDIRALLDTQLQTVSNLPSLQTENTRLNPGGLPFVRSTLLPAEPTPLTVGPNGIDEHQGLYQVDLFYPQDHGVGTPGALAASVLAMFPRGLILSTGTACMHVKMSWQEVAYQVNNWYVTPITIRWVAYPI